MKRFFSVRYLVLVIAGLAIAYHFHITRKRFVDGNAQLKTELSDLKGEWIELRLKEGATAYAKQELIKVNKEMDRLSDEAAQIRQSVSVEQLAIESLEKRKKALFFEYREQVRRGAKGMRFDEMRTPQGKHYENIVIIKVGPDGVSFRHGAAGSASGRGIGLGELPSEWVKRFMFTREELEWARSWTSADGTKTAYGKFKSYDEDTGIVTIDDGAGKLLFDIDQLSVANRKWLEKQALKGKAEAVAIFEELDKQVIGSKIKKGVLSKLEGDHFFDFTMSNAPDYYVVYYSASW